MADNDSRQRMTCEPCRQRKVRCNRGYPECGRCSRLGISCAYRDRVTHRATQSAVIYQLQARLREAEARLAGQNAPDISDDATRQREHTVTSTQSPITPQAVSTAPSYPELALQNLPPTIFDSGMLDLDDNTDGHACFDFDAFKDAPTPGFNQLMLHEVDTSAVTFSLPDWVQASSQPSAVDETTVMTEQSLIPSEHLDALHRTFFTTFAPVMPILAQGCFQKELGERPDDIALKSVSYTIALLGASISESHHHLEKLCYSQARYFIDVCEIGDESKSFRSIHFLQALLFLARYEVNKQYCARAWLTLGRAIGVAKIMRLEQMDHGWDSSPTKEPQIPHLALQSTTNLVELEERRRCFWALYILEGFCCITTDRIGTLKDSEIFVFLPSAGDLDDSLEPTNMPYVTEVSMVGNMGGLSPFCGAVIVLSLLRRVLGHLADSNSQQTGLWDRHYKLVNLVDSYNNLLRPLFSTRAVYSDTVVFNMYLTFCGVEIRLYEAAIDQADQQGLSKLISTESAKQSLASALKVVSAVRSTWNSQRPLCNTLSLSSAFVAWPLTTAIRALNRHILSEQNDTYENMIRMLHGILDDVDGPDGPWQKLMNELPSQNKR